MNSTLYKFTERKDKRFTNNKILFVMAEFLKSESDTIQLNSPIISLINS
jgi:hypothetical protein